MVLFYGSYFFTHLDDTLPNDMKQQTNSKLTEMIDELTYHVLDRGLGIRLSTNVGAVFSC
jgi:hypothetical protein